MTKPTGKPRGAPKRSTDPAVNVSIRLRRSQYEALRAKVGPDGQPLAVCRQLIEAFIAGDLAWHPVAVEAVPVAKATSARPG